MDIRAEELLATLRNSNVSIDAKTTSIGKLKSEIKQRNVPDAAVSPLFESLRITIASQHSSLSSAGLSALGHLLKRLTLQGQNQAIVAHGRGMYPLLLERLGDHKERIRSQAAQAFSDFWMSAPADVEHHVLETAMVGKNARAKEASIAWLARMTREQGLLFRTYVPALVACLEDADGVVRETAKTTVIEVFQNAPPRALVDLKKQLASHNVRKTIVTSIFGSLNISDANLEPQSFARSQSRAAVVRPTSSFSHRRDEIPRPNSVLSARSQSHADVHGMMPMDSVFQGENIDGPGVKPALSHTVSDEPLPLASTEPADSENLEPLYVNSHREFDDIVRDIIPCFEGKESEQNWILREKSITVLRRLTRGNAPHDYQQYYLVGIKSLLDGILKTAHSLRTTVSAAGCHLLQEIARTCGPAIDHMLEILFQSLLKLCSALKKITAQNGNVTVDIIIGNVTYSNRMMQHIWAACQDKNVQPRQFATGWIRTILTRHGHHKGALEHSGGLELIEKCIRKGLGDPNPGVRESMRGTFWAFYKVWPENAEAIKAALESKSKALLERDSNNPHGNLTPQSSGSSRTNQAHSTGRPTLKETISAQKRARLAASKNAPPPRPESAQSFSDSKSVRPAIRRAAATSTVRVPTGEKLSQNTSLSSAPMRPVSRARRPELVRPATADPYSARRSALSDSQSRVLSPSYSPQKMKTKPTTTPRARAPPARPKSRIDHTPRNPSYEKPNSDQSLTPSPKLRRSRHSDADAISSTVRAKSSVRTPSQVNRDAVMASPGRAFQGMRGSPRGPASSEIDQDLPTSPLPPSLKSSPSTPIQARKLLSDQSVSRIPLSPSSAGRKATEMPTIPITPIHNSSSEQATNLSPQIVFQSSVASGANTDTNARTSNTLKVYEDPQSPESSDSNSRPSLIPGTPKTPESSTKGTHLEKLPLNESRSRNNVHLSAHDYNPVLQPSPILSPSSENLHRRWAKVEVSERRRSLSPRSKDPVKALDMVTRGLDRIRSGSLDVHGYRKFQTLLKYHESISKDESKFEEILMALLGQLEAPDGPVHTSKALDLKTQVLVTIRLMLSLNREAFAAFYPRTMTAIITARKHYELTNHIVSGLEETAEDIVSTCDPPEVIDAILDLLETEMQSQESDRMIAMGSYVLSGLLRRLNNKRLYLTQSELERLGKFANQNLRSTQPDVRRAIIEFSPELYDMVESEDTFWSMVNSSVEDFRPLLTYYIMRRPPKIAVPVV